MNPTSTNRKTASVDAERLRQLPSVDGLLKQASVLALAKAIGRSRVTDWARRAIDELRERFDSMPSVDRDTLVGEAVALIEARAQAETSRRLRRVINATGVVLHTNLGRAPLADAAMDAIHDAARYTNLEIDLTTGRRGRRGALVEELWCELTGAEAALVVNNCAAATLLVLQSLAAGREVVISRGQLIEIGGSYRLPDVFEASGAVLREVGTTNRTQLADYEAAISDQTTALLRVHHSNYRIAGFASDVPIGPLVTLARGRELITVDDVGSGCLSDLSPYGLTGEPVVRESLRDGADLVLFSGDKLVGGPQSGMIVGRRDLVEQIRAHPLTRAMRVDKLTLAALQATLEIHLAGNAFEQIPVLRSLTLSADAINNRADALVTMLGERRADLKVNVQPVKSPIGGGSLPDQTLESWAVALNTESPDRLAETLRTGCPPVLPRIENDTVLLDLRTVHSDEDSLLIERLAQI